MKIPNLISESLELIFGLKIFKFFDADPDPGSFLPWIRDPVSGMPGMEKIRIQDKSRILIPSN
jgi:hypothetical protein